MCIQGDYKNLLYPSRYNVIFGQTSDMLNDWIQFNCLSKSRSLNSENIHTCLNRQYVAQVTNK